MTISIVPDAHENANHDDPPVLEAILHTQIDAFPADLRLVGDLTTIQQTARALADQGLRPRTRRVRARQPVPVAPAPAPTAPTDDDLIDVLLPALHLLFVGPTRSGKSSIVHELAQRWVASGQAVLVCDPDAAPGLWSGCEVVGGGDDWLAISETLDRLSAEITHRRQLRATGQQRAFEPLYVVLCEYGDVVSQCEQAKGVVEMVLRRGGKLNIRLVLDLQDRLVKSMGMQGQSALRQNFSYVVEVTRQGTQRTARLTAHDNGDARVLSVPVLPDLDGLVARACGA